MDIEALKPDILGQFTGTENYWGLPLTRCKMTDGVNYLAENADCFWLVEKIAFSQIENPYADNPDFQVWRLVVKDGEGYLTCTDGDEGVLSEEVITYTDFPLPEVVIWYQHNVLLLPSEY